MTVEYKDGNRITALSTDLLPTNPQDGMVVEFTDTGAIGFRHNNQWQIPSAWEFLGSKKLTGTSDDCEVTLPDDKIRDNYSCLFWGNPSGTIRADVRLNSITATNYSSTESSNGTADGAGDTATTSAQKLGNSAASYVGSFATLDISNIINQEKLMSGHSVSGVTGSGTAPDRREFGGKYVGNELVKSINIWQQATGDWDNGTELIVTGQSANLTVPESKRFWKQIAFSESRGTSESIVASWEGDYDYLQYFIGFQTSTAQTVRLYPNGDYGNNCSSRYQQNGGTDITADINIAGMQLEVGGNDDWNFIYGTGVNKPTEEKLYLTEHNDAGNLGSDNAPNREEIVSKWDMTTNRINQFTVDSPVATDFLEGSFILVFGGNALW